MPVSTTAQVYKQPCVGEDLGDRVVFRNCWSLVANGFKWYGKWITRFELPGNPNEGVNIDGRNKDRITRTAR
jgi:hypothetical protein